MLNLYLGNYLLSKRLINPDTLYEMMELEKDARLRIGVLAMHEGLMTSAQVEETNETQKKVDARFGEIARDKGFLTEDQLDQLLEQQAKGSARLAQVLMDKGHFTAAEMEKVLLDYREENNLTEEELMALQQGDVENLLKPYVKLQCDLGGIPHHQAMYAAGSLFMRNLVRFIDHKAILDIENHQIPTQSIRGARQVLVGSLPMEVYLAMESDIYLSFAEKHGKIPMKEEDALADASVTEFLNLQNGLFSVWLSNADLPVTLIPPEIISQLPDPEIDPCVVIKFQTGIGPITIMMVPN